MEEEIEIWKRIDIDGIYEHEISNLGRVKSLPKNVKCSNGMIRFYDTLIKTNRIDSKGYCTIMLHFKNERKHLDLRVHRLVALAFIPNPENKPCVNHINGIRTDNRVENLEWCTYQENTAHAFNRGMIRNPSIKMTQCNVDEIRLLYSSGNYSCREIGLMFGLKQMAVNNIINYKTWK